MLCELCGKDLPFLKKAIIEGTMLNVCKDCASFGEGAEEEEPKPSPAGGYGQRPKRAPRQRKKTTSDIYEREEMQMVLVDDYSSVIKDGRREKGMSQDDLAKRLNEKKSIIAKLENGDMRPSDKLVKKLETTSGDKRIKGWLNGRPQCWPSPKTGYLTVLG